MDADLRFPTADEIVCAMTPPSEPRWRAALRDVERVTKRVTDLERRLEEAREEQRKAVVTAWSEMAPVGQIAEKANLAVVTVRKWAKAAGLPMRK